MMKFLCMKQKKYNFKFNKIKVIWRYFYSYRNINDKFKNERKIIIYFGFPNIKFVEKKGRKSIKKEKKWIEELKRWR